MTLYYLPESCDCKIVVVNGILTEFVPPRCNLHTERSGASVDDCRTHNLRFSLINDREPANDDERTQADKNLKAERERIRNLRARNG